MAEEALKGAVIGAITGTMGGAFNGALEYYEENGTLDGSTSKIIESASDGFMKGTAAGAASGVASGAMKYMKNPNGYCFVAGTIVATVLGFAAIETIQAGDYVLAKDVDTGIVSYEPVLQTFVREVDETYTITIDGEEIETTAEHPFYVENEGFVQAQDLEAGDNVETADGDTAEVDSVQKNELDESVLVYNFEVMDDHTYYVGETGVLVHNKCKVAKKSTTTKLIEGEGDVGTYKELLQAGSVGDDITPHHMPSAEYMANKGVAKADGLCMNVEMPSPGTGGRHRLTATFGRNMTDAQKAAYYAMTPRQALAHDVADLISIYKSQGLYEEIRPQLRQFIKTSIEMYPELFGK